MSLKWFICLDNERILITDCLKEGGCRMGSRCATRSYLQLVGNERVWKGKPSTTQLIAGTMYAFLRLTNDYARMPGDAAFMILGTKGHGALEASDDECSILEEAFNDEDTDVTGIADVLESELNKNILIDYKTSGSFKVAKALGFRVIKEPTGEKYKTGNRKGEDKLRSILKKDDSYVDRIEWNYQLNKYRMEFEKRGFKIDQIKVMVIVRDGNTFIARSRGVFRNIYYFNIDIMPDKEVNEYFDKKNKALQLALKQGYWSQTCSAEETWQGLRCQNYCEVAEYCSFGKYLKKEREVEDMAIKGLSEIRRLPRLGKIRLGLKVQHATKKKEDGTPVEYPKEVDYFILDPNTPSEEENKMLIEEFHKLYGENPKSFEMMLPVANPDVYFAQFYKRYGSSTMLKCKGDGEKASCSQPDYAEELKITGEDEMGLTQVECKGRECPHFKGDPKKKIKKECSAVGTLQVLIPKMPGAGVWQITTGSFHSIVNLNSCIDYICQVAGRAHMMPLTLERKAQEVQHDGKKSTHHILHINMEFKLSDLQKYAQIDPEKALLELPAPDAGKEDILFQENVEIEPGDAVIDVKAEKKKPEKKSEKDKKTPAAKKKPEEKKPPEPEKSLVDQLRAQLEDAKTTEALRNTWEIVNTHAVAQEITVDQQKKLSSVKNQRKAEISLEGCPYATADGKALDLEKIETTLQNALNKLELEAIWNELEPFLEGTGEIMSRMMIVRDKRAVKLNEEIDKAKREAF